MRSPLPLPSSPARSIATRLARFGAAGFAVALVAAPIAHADAPAPGAADTGTPPTDPGTPTDPVTPTDTVTPSDTATPTDAATPTDTASGTAPDPSPTSSAAPAKAGTAKRAQVKPAAVTPAALPIYGYQKVFVGVQTQSGGYYPPGTTTIGSTIEIAETGPVAPTGPPLTCTTVADPSDPTGVNSRCEATFAPGPGDSLVVRQISPPQPNLRIDPLPQTVGPCVAPVNVVPLNVVPNIAGPSAAPAADPPPCVSFPFDIVTLNFTDPGLPPIAVNDVSTVQTGGSVQVQVLPNDTTNGAPTTISAVSTPAHGTAALVGTHITYKPNAGFFGVDAFTYTITTANGSSTATVSITVTAPPIAVDDAASTLGGTDSAGRPVTVAVLANDKAQGGTLSLTAVGAATHGTATINGTTISYTPAAGFAGTDSFTYTITNGHGTSTATVTITVTAPLVADVGGLASTGAPSEQLLGAGSLLLVAGGGLALAGRRRRSNA
jgi:hypothetical protein